MLFLVGTKYLVRVKKNVYMSLFVALIFIVLVTLEQEYIHLVSRFKGKKKKSETMTKYIVTYQYQPARDKYMQITIV